MKSLFIIILALTYSQAYAGLKISCSSGTEMNYIQVNTLDNQSVKDEWQTINDSHILSIELTNKDYVLVNGIQAPIVQKTAGALYLTMYSKIMPSSNKAQGTVVMVSLAINMLIPSVTKTTLMTKYFLSSDIQASATSYKCKYNN